MVFNIQRYSIHDGEGIRTLVFYKGCPLRCRWCSNPEGFTFGYSVLYDRERCRGFGDCMAGGNGAISRNGNMGIQINRDLLKETGSLKDLCPSRALHVAGEVKSTDELLAEIEKDTPFYREDGGVTLSGGEPLSQGEELAALLRELKTRRVRVNIETSLHVEWKQVERCLGLVDLFMVDLKHTDPLKYRSFTGGTLALVENNLRRLVSRNENILIRIPVIPGFNHTAMEMEKIIDLADSLGVIKEIHFLPFHTMGSSKYTMLGLENTYADHPPVREREIGPYLRYAASKGIKARTGG